MLLRIALIVVLATSVMSSRAESVPAQPFPLLELFAGIHRIEAEVAATADARRFGLMERKSMPIQRGMLFVFPSLGKQCMWMRNTFLPLSVAFLDDSGRIINIEDMQPQTEISHCASSPARYALEMNLGWFRSRGLRSGTVLSGFEKVPKPY